MDNVYTRLWVGDDADYLRIAHKEDWSVLRCCKYGPGGHQQILGYHTPAAPKGPNYLIARPRGNTRHLALNMLDLDDPHFFDPKMIKTGLDFIQEQLDKGQKVLVACNKGHSRGPTMAFMFLRMIGDLWAGFIQSENVFKTLYPAYSPGIGMRQFARSHWNTLGRMALGDELHDADA